MKAKSWRRWLPALSTWRAQVNVHFAFHSFHSRSSADSFAFEFRFCLREERLVADPEVLGAEALEAFIVFFGGKRLRIAQAAREFLVPAGDERRAVGDALGRLPRLLLHLAVGHD